MTGTEAEVLCQAKKVVKIRPFQIVSSKSCNDDINNRKKNVTFKIRNFQGQKPIKRISLQREEI